MQDRTKASSERNREPEMDVWGSPVRKKLAERAWSSSKLMQSGKPTINYGAARNE